jgi:hypothetical protein
MKLVSSVRAEPITSCTGDCKLYKVYEVKSHIPVWDVEQNREFSWLSHIQHLNTSDQHRLNYDDTIAGVLRISSMMNPLVP